MRVLVTGAAGFIGFGTVRALLGQGHEVFGIDNLNDYYDPELKRRRLRELGPQWQPHFRQADIADATALREAFARWQPTQVVHLAAQAGVRYSLDHPDVYVSSNLVGFANMLECCRQFKVAHFVFASTSSVYGASRRIPFSEHSVADHPVSFYAATKKANEMMAHSYAWLYRTPCTGLRFFTVYGPWGRPDMALFKFTRAILAGQPIEVYNNGQMVRDFTYVDDIVEGIVRTLAQPATPDAKWDAKNPDPASSPAPYRIYNIGNSQPVNLMRYIEVLEKSLGRKATIEFKPMQPGDVQETWADTTELRNAVGYKPQTTIEAGVQRFVDWYREYY
ncbi:MAG TPA: NAD-dependent epimerase [Steroidobacteraceae bacterium]